MGAALLDRRRKEREREKGFCVAAATHDGGSDQSALRAQRQDLQLRALWSGRHPDVQVLPRHLLLLGGSPFLGLGWDPREDMWGSLCDSRPGGGEGWIRRR